MKLISFKHLPWCNLNLLEPLLDSLPCRGKEVKCVTVLHPDPWFKAKHHKRRVMNTEFAAALTQRLHPGSTIRFQSDVLDTFVAGVEELEQFLPFGLESKFRTDHAMPQELLEEVDGRIRQGFGVGIPTEREQYVRANDGEIWYAEFVKKG